MNERNYTIEFIPSYTLDIICFMDQLFSNETYPEEEIINYFEERLVDYGEDFLRKARKLLPKGKTFSSMLFPVITIDPEFNNLKLSELFRSAKYLINQYRKSPQYKVCSKEYKKFLKHDAEVVINLLQVVMGQLEKADFKSFWLKNRLPLINQKIKLYQKEIYPLLVVEKLNALLGKVFLYKQSIHVLSFANHLACVLINEQLITSTKLTSKQLVHSYIEELFEPTIFQSELKRLNKIFKKNRDLIESFKKVKKEHQTLAHYVEFNVRLAFMTYIATQFNVLDNPYEYLGRYQFGAYKLSLLYYDYILTNPMNDDQELDRYLLKIVREVELDSFEQRSNIMMRKQF